MTTPAHDTDDPTDESHEQDYDIAEKFDGDVTAAVVKRESYTKGEKTHSGKIYTERLLGALETIDEDQQELLDLAVHPDESGLIVGLDRTHTDEPGWIDNPDGATVVANVVDVGPPVINTVVETEGLRAVLRRAESKEMVIRIDRGGGKNCEPTLGEIGAAVGGQGEMFVLGSL